MVVDPLTGVTSKFAIDVAKQAIPVGTAWAQNWWKSKKLLVVGQERAGKTALCDYIRYGFLGKLGETTLITQDPKKYGMCKLQFGASDRALELSFRNMVDSAGQAGPREHARLVVRRKPHIVVVVLDVTTPQLGKPNGAYLTWFEQFSLSINEFFLAQWLFKGRPLAIVVLLNKVDLFEEMYPEENLSQQTIMIKKMMQDSFAPFYPLRVISNFPVLPTCLVDSLDAEKRGRDRIDRALHTLALLFR